MPGTTHSPLGCLSSSPVLASTHSQNSNVRSSNAAIYRGGEEKENDSKGGLLCRLDQRACDHVCRTKNIDMCTVRRWQLLASESLVSGRIFHAGKVIARVYATSRLTCCSRKKWSVSSESGSFRKSARSKKPIIALSEVLEGAIDNESTCGVSARVVLFPASVLIPASTRSDCVRTQVASVG